MRKQLKKEFSNIDCVDQSGLLNFRTFYDFQIKIFTTHNYWMIDIHIREELIIVYVYKYFNFGIPFQRSFWEVFNLLKGDQFLDVPWNLDYKHIVILARFRFFSLVWSQIDVTVTLFYKCIFYVYIVFIKRIFWV